MPGRSERDRAPHRLALRLTYTQAEEAGGVAVVVPAHGFLDDTEALLDRLDGLIFSGGPDIDPAVYGQTPHPQLGPDVDLVSDEYELALHSLAAERDLPVLGRRSSRRPSAPRCSPSPPDPQPRIFQYESLRLILPPENSNRSHPRTSIGSPFAWVPRIVHSDAPRSPAVKCRASP